MSSVSESAAPAPTPAEIQRAKRKAAAQRGLKTKAENDRKKWAAEREALEADRRGRAAEYRKALCTTTKEEAEFRAAAVVPVWTRLVLGGAPPALADALAKDMTAHRAEHGTSWRFLWARPMERMGLDGYPCVADGCDMPALLKAAGFTEVKWAINSDNRESIWRCEFVYRID